MTTEMCMFDCKSKKSRGQVLFLFHMAQLSLLLSVGIRIVAENGGRESDCRYIKPQKEVSAHNR